MAAYQTQTFLISRTDAIGDVVLTLPLCGWLKMHYPNCRIVFLGRTYTGPIIAACPYVDAFLNWDELQQLPEPEQIANLQAQKIDAVIHVFPNKSIAFLARRAGIKTRIGTRNRWFHWLSCNSLVPVSRRHSPLHESQLNFGLLKPLGLVTVPPLETVSQYLKLQPVQALPALAQSWFQPGKKAVILHPKSQGSAREWGLEKFGALAKMLHTQGYQVFISGTAKEQRIMQEWLRENQGWITDITGRLSLPEFISFISQCHGLVGASTGPLHIAAALGVNALAIFPPIKPMHPGRWAPIGLKAGFLVLDKDCHDCRNRPAACACIGQISVASVAARIGAWQ